MGEKENGFEERKNSLTVLEADGVLNSDVKEFGKSEKKIQELLNKVGISQDGIIKCQLKQYKYRLTLTGKMPNAAKKTTYVVLTNQENLTFEKVAKSLFSSSSDDWIDDTVIADMK